MEDAGKPMEAGRDMDALIAERVMGLALGCRHEDVSLVEGTGSLMVCGACGRMFGQTTLAMDRGRLPFYSTDIAAAWEIVEKLDVRGEGAFFEIHRNRAGWLATYFDPGYRPFQDTRGEAEAIAAPLAICLAALKSIEAALKSIEATPISPALVTEDDSTAPTRASR